MEIKIVYQTNPLGVYVGTTVADQSPLEPGVFLIPYGCVETPPPLVEESEIAVWGDGGWVIKPAPELTPVEITPQVGLIPETPEVRERAWRDAELRRADIMLNRIQDGMSSFGTVGAWRAYRVELRDWPTCVQFPEVVSRPTAPDTK